MKYFLLLIFSTLTVSLNAQIMLPVEVLGDQWKIEERTFSLTSDEANATDRMWLQVNNLSYENKASIKINDGAWYNLNHESVEMQHQEKARGGMVHGGYSTIRFTIPASGFVAGSNTISFRFNLSDGISIGYRVVDFNLLTSSGSRILSEDKFIEEDPMTWESPYSDAASIAEGKLLWEEATLWSNYLEEDTTGKWYAYELGASAPIKATCASCHVGNGFDLEYFSYSNESIIERSKFHKLTEEEGKKIASYIRTLSDEIPQLDRYGRPWDPPYQPGPDLQGKSIDEWAAGAGLGAVLDNDEDMLSYMFPDGVVDSTSVAGYFNSDKVEDHTLMPLSVQLPDWKHWLPIVHPMDAFSKDDFYNTADLPIHPKKGMERIEAYLETMPPADRNKDDLQNELRIFHRHFRHFMDQTEGEVRHWRTGGDAVRENKYNERVAAIPDEIPVEMAVTSLARLLAVKNFEFMNIYQLQDKAHWFTIDADSSELTPRQWQWIGIDYNVFEVPPHFTSCVNSINCDEFVGQPTPTGHYESTAWYQLQLVVNGGNGHTGPNHPMDWQYQLDFIKRASFSSGIPEPIRYYHSLNAMYQLRTNQKNPGPNSGRGFRARQQMPHWFFGINDNNSFSGFKPGAFPALLDQVQPGMQKLFLDALLRQFLIEVQKSENSLDLWQRRAPYGGSNELEPASTNRSLINIEQQLGLYYYVDKMYYLIPKFAEVGVDCRIINELVDWSAEAWPAYNWEQFRQLTRSSVVLQHAGNDECSPIPEKFTAVFGNQGKNPVIQWSVNGEIQPEASAEFVYPGLQPGDQVSVRVISSNTCVNNKEATASYTIRGENFIVMVNKNDAGWTDTTALNVCDGDQIEVKVEMPLEPLLWLDAYELSADYSNGEKVSNWSDRSGNEFQVSADREELYPYFDNRGFDGRPAVMFGMNDNADGLRLFSTEDDDFMEEDWTMAIVGEQLGIDNWADVVGNKTESKFDDGWFMRFSSNGRTEISAGGAYYGGSNYQFPYKFIAVMQKKGREVSFYLNGKHERSLTINDGETITTANEIFLGLADKGNANSSRYHRGPIAEVLFFDQAIDQSERKVLEGYLGHKWGLNTALPVAHLYANTSPLDVNLLLPNQENIAFNSNTKTYSYTVDQHLQGYLTFSQGACAASNHTIDLSYLHDPERTEYSIAYSVNDLPVLTGAGVNVIEGQTVRLFPGGEFGDYQWEQPDGTRLNINENPVLTNISSNSSDGNWLMHVGIVACYGNQEKALPFEVNLIEDLQHQINITLDGAGFSNLEGEVLVNQGNDLLLNLLPDTGFKVSAITIDGVAQAISANQGDSLNFKIENVSTSQEVRVIFEERATHQVSLAVGEGGGSALSSGVHEVRAGDSWSVLLEASEGYRLLDVIIDGESKGALSKVYFERIGKDYDVEAQFEPFNYEIIASSGENGNITPVGINNYAHGEEVTFTFTPDEAYEISAVYIDGNFMGKMSEYVFDSISSGHSVNVTFRESPVFHTIEVIQSENGAITPESQEVLEGESASFVILPDEGYFISDVLVDGESVGKIGRYAFRRVEQSHTIEARFEKFVVSGLDSRIAHVFPNPFRGEFNITTNEAIEKVEIFNMQGRKLSFTAYSNWSEIALKENESKAALLFLHIYYENDRYEVVKIMRQ